MKYGSGIWKPGQGFFPCIITALIFTFNCFTGEVQAQCVFPSSAGGYHVNVINQDLGLIQNSISDIVLDRYGFTWLSTQGGICRYDGKTVVSFSRYDGVGGSPRVVRFFYGKNNQLYALCEDKSIFLIADGQVIHKEAYNEQLHGQFLQFSSLSDFSHDFKKFGLPDSLLNNPNQLILPVLSWKGKKWVYFHENGISFYKDNQLVRTLNLPPFNLSNFGFDGRFLAYASGSQIYLYDSTGRLFYRMPLTGFSEGFRIFSDPESGHIFLAYKDFIYTLQQTGDACQLKPFIPLNGLDAKNITFIREIKGRVYVGTFTCGLLIYTPHIFSAFGDTKPYPVKSSLYGNIALGESTLLCGNGLIFKDGRFQQQIPGFDKVSDYSFLYDASGNIWAGQTLSSQRTGPSVILRSKLAHPELCERFQEIRGVIKVFYKDSRDRTWICAAGEIGFFDSREHYSSVFSEADIKLMGEPEYLLEDVEGHGFYLGTKSGLYFINELKDNFSVRVIGLKDIDVRYLLLDSGFLWVTTYGRGLFCLNTKSKADVLVSLPMDQKGYLAYAHSLIPDNRERFWVPTNNGIFVMYLPALRRWVEEQKERPYYFYYNKSDGLLTNEFNGGCEPAFTRFTNGEVVLPSINGLVRFRPDSINPAFPSDPLLVQEVSGSELFLVHNQDTLYTSGRKNIPLQLLVSSSCYSSGLNEVIEYSLTSRDANKEVIANEWSEVSGGKVNLSFLANGMYILRFRKRSGFNSYVYQEVFILVPAPWYLRLWFYILCILFLAVGYYFIYRLRTRYLKNQNRNLEKKIRDAYSDLLQSNDQLLQSNQIKDKLIGSVSHDISMPVHFINFSLDSLLKSENRDAGMKRDLELLAYTAAELQNHTDELIQWIRVQRGAKTLMRNIASVPLSAFLQIKWKIFIPIAQSRHIQLKNVVSNDLHVYTDEVIFGIIVFNLMSNVVKHSSDCSLVIRTEEKEGNLLLEFRNVQQESSPVSEEGELFIQQKVGLGLHLVEELAAAIDLQFQTITDAQSFTAILRFGNKYYH